MKNFYLEESKDGFNILKLEDKKKCYIGSKYNHKRDIEKLIESMGEKTEKDIYIIFGGCALEYVSELKKNIKKENKVLIIEVIDEIYSFIKEEGFDKSIKEYENIEYINKIDDLKIFLNDNVTEFNVENLKIITFSNYNKIFTEEIVEYYKFIREVKIRLAINKNTKIAFKNDWVSSLISTANELEESYKINEFKDYFKNIPAIIVSAGPSLSRNVENVNKSNAYIISGGRTVKPLLENGIDPDFTVAVDGSEASYNLLDGYFDKTQSSLIYTEMTNYKIIEQFIGQKIVGSSNVLIKSILKNDIENIIHGGSVANTMTFVAAYMGFNPIVFIGQDLAYTNGEHHSVAAVSKHENIKNNIITEDEKVYVKDIYGQEVKSSEAFKLFKIGIENTIKAFNKTKFIDATEGGAYIEGTEVMTLNEFNKLYSRNIDRLDWKFNKINNVNEVIMEKYETEKKLLENGIKLSLDGNKVLKKFRRIYNYNTNEKDKIIGKLNNIDRKLNEIIKKLEFVESLIYDFIFKLENDEKYILKDSDNKNEVLNKRFALNKAIYDGVFEICNSNIKIIDDAKNKLNNKM